MFSLFSVGISLKTPCFARVVFPMDNPVQFLGWVLRAKSSSLPRAGVLPACGLRGLVPRAALGTSVPLRPAAAPHLPAWPCPCAQELDRIINQMVHVAEYLEWDSTELKPVSAQLGPGGTRGHAPQRCATASPCPTDPEGNDGGDRLRPRRERDAGGVDPGRHDHHPLAGPAGHGDGEAPLGPLRAPGGGHGARSHGRAASPRQPTWAWLCSTPSQRAPVPHMFNPGEEHPKKCQVALLGRDPKSRARAVSTLFISLSRFFILPSFVSARCIQVPGLLMTVCRESLGFLPVLGFAFYGDASGQIFRQENSAHLSGSWEVFAPRFRRCAHPVRVSAAFICSPCSAGSFAWQIK